MNLTDVRIHVAKNDDTKLKAIASITIDDCFVVHDIKIILGKDGYFIAMPSRKKQDGTFKDIAHPINSETREQMQQAILLAFEQSKQEQSALTD